MSGSWNPIVCSVCNKKSAAHPFFNYVSLLGFITPFAILSFSPSCWNLDSDLIFIIPIIVGFAMNLALSLTFPLISTSSKQFKVQNFVFNIGIILMGVSSFLLYAYGEWYI